MRSPALPRGIRLMTRQRWEKSLSPGGNVRGMPVVRLYLQDPESRWETILGSLPAGVTEAVTHPGHVDGGLAGVSEQVHRGTRGRSRGVYPARRFRRTTDALPRPGHGLTRVTELRIEKIRDDVALAALAPEWRTLQADTGARNPFLFWEWTSACSAHVCPGAEPFVLAARTSEGRLVGLAPLCLERKLGARVLRFIGDGRSDYLGFLVDPVVPGVERALPSASRSSAARGTSQCCAISRRTTRRSRQIACRWGSRLTRLRAPSAPTSRSRATGTSSWPPARAASSTRDAGRGSSSAGWRGAAAHRAGGPRRLDDVCEIEARSRKGEAGTARFQPGPGRELLGAALETASPESLELWLVLYYQGAYDREQRSHYARSPTPHCPSLGAWAEGRREYDFMVGDETYKADWCNAERTLPYLAVHPRTARGRAALGPQALGAGPRGL